jgi:AraC-like DNA-binding protein
MMSAREFPPDQMLSTRAAVARFNVSAVPVHERFDVWHASIGCIFDVDLHRQERQERGFHATLDGGLIGALMVVRTRTVAQRWRRPLWKIARDGLDHYMIQYYAAGTQVCDWAGGSVAMPRAGLLVYDLSREMVARSSDLDNLSLIIPRQQLAPLLRQPDAHHMRALPASGPLVAMLCSHMQHLRINAGRLEGGESAELAQASLHLVAACLNAGEPDYASDDSELVPTQLIAAKRFVDARLWDPGLDAAAIGRHLGVSRSRLYEILSGLGGAATYIRERRLQAALSMLVDPNQQHLAIAAIAERCLLTPSEFSRRFSRRFGISPSAARHQAQAPRIELRDYELDRSYERWLQELSAAAPVPGHWVS